jgi:hypothetical protein
MVGAEKQRRLAFCYTAILARINGKIYDSAGRGRDSDAVPSPHPFPARRINEMTSTTEQRHNLYEPRTVSREGFTTETAAGVATANCLNGGVHPTSL